MLLREKVLENDDTLTMIDREEYIPENYPPSSTEQTAQAEKFRFYNKAINLLEEIIAHNPDYVEAHVQLARCYLKRAYRRKL